MDVCCFDKIPRMYETQKTKRAYLVSNIRGLGFYSNAIL